MRKKNPLVRKSKVFLRIYGKTYVSGPYKSFTRATIEYIVHELCHMVFLDVSAEIGDMRWTADSMGQILKDDKPSYASDLHEIRALAAELLVARRLRLPIHEKTIVNYARVNSMNLEWGKCRFLKAVRRAKKLGYVQFAADQVSELYLLHSAKCKPTEEL